jgi:hypothetical protein
MADLPKGFYARTLARAYPKSGVYKVALYKSVPDIDAYTSVGECEGDGYAAGGVTLTGWKVVEQEDGGAMLAFDTTYDLFDVTVKTRAAVIYDAESGDVISIVDFKKDVGVIGGVFSVYLPREGVVGLGPHMNEIV